VIKYAYYFGVSHAARYHLVDGSFRFEGSRAIKDLSNTDPELTTALKVAARMAGSRWVYVYLDDAGNIVDAPEGYIT
jgi:hypothetical protein